MPFKARNSRYLQISAHTVLSLYIYIDDTHIEWMSDHVLNCVLTDLKPIIGPKLRKESAMSGGSGKHSKGTVDTHRGDTYEFAYFLRKNEPHAVLLKSRTFVHVPALLQKAPSLEMPPSAQKERESGIATGTTSPSHEASLELECSSPSLREKRRRSRRDKVSIAGGYMDAEQEESDSEMNDPDLMRDGTYTPDSDHSDTALPVQMSAPLSSQIPEEEEKPKMALRLSFQGFAIYDKCLCIAVQPRSSFRGVSRGPSTGLGEATLASIKVADESGRRSMPHRERTPLFLPDDDPRRSFTPAPILPNALPPHSFLDDLTEFQVDEDGDVGGMMAFSQALKSLGNERAGSADEDEGLGEVFLGDADERKGSL